MAPRASKWDVGGRSPAAPSPQDAERLKQAAREAAARITAGMKGGNIGVHEDITINNEGHEVRTLLLSRRDLMTSVEQQTGTCIAVKGRYYPPGSMTDPKMPPLFLQVTPMASIGNDLNIQRTAVSRASDHLRAVMAGSAQLGMLPLHTRSPTRVFAHPPPDLQAAPPDQDAPRHEPQNHPLQQQQQQQPAASSHQPYYLASVMPMAPAGVAPTQQPPVYIMPGTQAQPPMQPFPGMHQGPAGPAPGMVFYPPGAQGVGQPVPSTAPLDPAQQPQPGHHQPPQQPVAAAPGQQPQVHGLPPPTQAGPHLPQHFAQHAPLPGQPGPQQLPHGPVQQQTQSPPQQGQALHMQGQPQSMQPVQHAQNMHPQVLQQQVLQQPQNAGHLSPHAQHVQVHQQLGVPMGHEPQAAPFKVFPPGAQPQPDPSNPSQQPQENDPAQAAAQQGFRLQDTPPQGQPQQQFHAYQPLQQQQQQQQMPQQYLQPNPQFQVPQEAQPMHAPPQAQAYMYGNSMQQAPSQPQHVQPGQQPISQQQHLQPDQQSAPQQQHVYPDGQPRAQHPPPQQAASIAEQAGQRTSPQGHHSHAPPDTLSPRTAAVQESPGRSSAVQESRPSSAAPQPSPGEAHAAVVGFDFPIPTGFPLLEQVKGPEGSYLDHIRVQTGAGVHLRGSAVDDPISSGPPLELWVFHSDAAKRTSAYNLARSLYDTVKAAAASSRPASTSGGAAGGKTGGKGDGSAVPGIGGGVAGAQPVKRKFRTGIFEDSTDDMDSAPSQHSSPPSATAPGGGVQQHQQQQQQQHGGQAGSGMSGMYAGSGNGSEAAGAIRRGAQVPGLSDAVPGLPPSGQGGQGVAQGAHVYSQSYAAPPSTSNGIPGIGAGSGGSQGVNAHGMVQHQGAPQQGMSAPSGPPQGLGMQGMVPHALPGGGVAGAPPYSAPQFGAPSGMQHAAGWMPPHPVQAPLMHMPQQVPQYHPQPQPGAAQQPHMQPGWPQAQAPGGPESRSPRVSTGGSVQGGGDSGRPHAAPGPQGSGDPASHRPPAKRRFREFKEQEDKPKRPWTDALPSYYSHLANGDSRNEARGSAGREGGAPDGVHFGPEVQPQHMQAQPGAGLGASAANNSVLRPGFGGLGFVPMGQRPTQGPLVSYGDD